MVTMNITKAEAFTVAITRLHDGQILISIARQDGQTRSYEFPEKKLRVLAFVDTALKDAVEFFLGKL
jgi:hypothetical protein